MPWDGVMMSTPGALTEKMTVLMLWADMKSLLMSRSHLGITQPLGSDFSLRTASTLVVDESEEAVLEEYTFRICRRQEMMVYINSIY